MENKSHALAAGVFMLLLTALLVATAVWLTRDNRALHEFELAGAVNLSGLQPQSAVRYHGVPVGKVLALGLDPQDARQVRVRIAIDDQVPVNAATYATLGYQGVTGLAFVQLDSHAGAPATPLAGYIPLEPALMSRLSDQGERLLGQLTQASERVNALFAPAHQQALLRSLERIGAAAAELQQFSAQARHSLPALTQAGTDALTSLKTTTAKVGDGVDEARRAAEALRQVAAQLAASGGTLDRLDQGSQVLIATGQALQHGTLPRLDQALGETALAAQQLGALGQTLNDDPQALLRGRASPAPGPGEPGFTAPPH